MISEVTRDDNWISAGQSHTGKVRELNEDAILQMDAENLWLVADGMGGHSAGDISSQMIVDALREYRHGRYFGHNVHNIVAALARVNIDLTEYATNKCLGTIGSTVAVLMTQGRYLAVIWAGDSRVYRLRNGRLHQLTIDHDQVFQFMKMGISEERARQLPGSEVITRAIGSDELLLPQVNLYEIQSGDRFLLCTDGLTKEVSDETIEGALAAFDYAKACDVLMRKSLESGARDNVSIVVVDQP